jgi:hypothetical protein
MGLLGALYGVGDQIWSARIECARADYDATGCSGSPESAGGASGPGVAAASASITAVLSASVDVVDAAGGGPTFTIVGRITRS